MVGYDYNAPSSVTLQHFGGSSALNLYKLFCEIAKNGNTNLQVFEWADALSPNTEGFINTNKPILGLIDGIPNQPVNPNYHKPVDTWSTLNYDYMTNIVKSTALFLCDYSVNGLVNVKEDNNPIVPLSPQLYDPFPNPFNASVKLKFSVPEPSIVTLSVYDMLGREISVIENSEINPGTYERIWNAGEFSSGIYFCRISITGKRNPDNYFVNMKKVILLK